MLLEARHFEIIASLQISTNFDELKLWNDERGTVVIAANISIVFFSYITAAFRTKFIE